MINKSRNLFLEKEELNRLDTFVFDEGIIGNLKNSMFSDGLILSGSRSYPYSFGGNFQFSQGSDHTKVKLSEDSIAYTPDGQRILYKHSPLWEFQLPYLAGGTQNVWVYIERDTTHIEQGTVAVAINGEVTGVGTSFSEVFRGAASLVPNKIRIYERTSSDTGGNDGYTYSLVGTYEVASVTSDTAMFINASSALPAGDYVYSVVGAFSPGTFDDTREEEIYTYDHFNIGYSLTNPTLSLVSGQYIIAKITVNDSSGTQQVTDLRKDIFSVADTSASANIAIIMDAFLQSGWENMIISGGVWTLLGSGGTIGYYSITTGYLYVEGSIYPIKANASIPIDAGLSENAYWDVFQDTDGIFKARIKAASSQGSYYNFDDDWRLTSRLTTI